MSEEDASKVDEFIDDVSQNVEEKDDNVSVVTELETVSAEVEQIDANIVELVTESVKESAISEKGSKEEALEENENEDQPIEEETTQELPEHTSLDVSPGEQGKEEQSEIGVVSSMSVTEENRASGGSSIRYDISPDEQRIEVHPLDELTDQQVIDVVNEAELEYKHLELENILFENFLQENDPTLLEGMDDLLAYFKKKSVSSAPDIEEIPSRVLEKQKLKLDSYTSLTSIAEGKGPKINLSQKTDMVMRAMEENQLNLQSFLKRSHITKRNYKSELDEFAIREAEIKEATDIFEYSVVTQGVDKLTQRIPAEKFIRYMEEWLKSAQLQIEKLRLRLATLKVQYKKVSQQLIQRQELGENVHAVDFDQLEIENKHFLEKIEQKNVHLVELKKMNGGANLILSIHKKYLQKQQEDYNKLKAEIAEKNRLIEKTEEEYQETDGELEQVRTKLDQCKNLKSSYTVPEVYDYVKLKAKMHELGKNMKVWFRRRKIQDIALNTCIRDMKRLTGSEEIDAAWFDETPSINSVSSNDMLL